MKLKFKNQDFQTDATDAVADLFKGQELLHSTFEIAQNDQYSFIENDLGIGNGMRISVEKLNENMHEVQKRGNLPLTDIEDDNLSFCIEMETGTGKTYVYTKTIFELNKRYGFTKFILSLLFPLLQFVKAYINPLKLQKSIFKISMIMYRTDFLYIIHLN